MWVLFEFCSGRYSDCNGYRVRVIIVVFWFVEINIGDLINYDVLDREFIFILFVCIIREIVGLGNIDYGWVIIKKSEFYSFLMMVMLWEGFLMILKCNIWFL